MEDILRLEFNEWAKAGRGDLLVTVRIALPEMSDPELEALMKTWRSDKPFDPRKDM